MKRVIRGSVTSSNNNDHTWSCGDYNIYLSGKFIKKAHSDKEVSQFLHSVDTSQLYDIKITKDNLQRDHRQTEDDVTLIHINREKQRRGIVESAQDATFKTDKRLSPTSERYKGYLIVLDRGGDGYNVYDKHRELEDAGYPSRKAAKEFIDSLLVEDDQFISSASYGGAFDIEDNQYFSKDEIVEFGNTVCDHLNETFYDTYDVSDVYMETPKKLVLTVIQKSDESEFTATVDIDMRKIKQPSDLMNRYLGDVVYALQQDIKAYNDEINASSDITSAQKTGVDWIKTKIWNAASAKMEDMGFPVDEIPDYLFVDVKKANDHIRVEVRAELTYKWLTKLIDELDPIVQSFDKDSYFEPVQPGIAEAYIWNISKINASIEDEEDLPQAEQEYDSAKTSINSNKLPAIYNMITLPEGSVGIDYGGGKFDNAVEALAEQGVTLHVYDPYNRSQQHNRAALKALRANGGADFAINSNVLNVIKEPEARLNVLENIKTITKPGAPIYITVYEGSGKGNEGVTKSGYQLNRKTADYLEEIQQVFPDAKRRGKLIVATNSKSVNSSTNIKASSTEGYVYTHCDECGKKNRVKVTFNNFNEPFNDTEYKCKYCGAHNLLTDPHSYDKNGNVVEASQSYLDRIEELMEQGLDEETASREAYAEFYPDEYDVDDYDEIYSANYGGAYDIDPPEDNRWEELDLDDAVIELTLDAIVHIDEDGSWEYEDTNYPWAASPDNKRGGWYTDENDVYIGDKTAIVEYVDELLEPMMPAKAGEYHIKGDVTLVFSVEGIQVKRNYFWDERHGEDYDEESYTDDAEASFLYDKSYIKNFEITER